MVVLGDTATPSGPVVPEYETPPIVKGSQQDSVVKLVTDSVLDRCGVIVHDW